MTLAVLSLVSLIVAIVIGIFKPKLNIGFLGVAIAFIVGFFFAGLSEKQIVAGFPSSLFLMLVGITTLFGIAAGNGTLDTLTQLLIRAARGNPKLFPITFFFLTFLLSAIGPGNIAATALIAPVGMAVAMRAQISPLLMAIMICTGANAGAFSPFAPTGIIGIGLMHDIGVDDRMVPYLIFGASALIQSVTALAAYLIFGGWRAQATPELAVFLESQRDAKFSRSQIATMIGIGALIVSVVFFHVPISIGAFVIAALLLFFELADGEVVVKMMPWDAIMLVTGITVLIGVLEKAGGMDLATTLIASYSSPNSINALLAFVTGILSAYSSSSGVVMPAFIPLVPGIIEKMGSGNIIEMLVAVAVGSHMVDVSPLSTLGALCIACIVNSDERSRVFRALLIWGMSMAVVGALLSWIFLDLL